jgi:hypothetical protein
VRKRAHIKAILDSGVLVNPYLGEPDNRFRWKGCAMKRSDRQSEPKVPANDNGRGSGESLDPRIRRIAEALGRHLARERARHSPPANDNEPGHE